MNMPIGSTSRPSRATPLLLLLIACAGCFRHVVQERQLGNQAYVSFPRLQSDAHVTLTGSRVYEFDAHGGGSTLFEIDAGRYKLVLTRGGATVTEREIYVSAGQTKEIDTP